LVVRDQGELLMGPEVKVRKRENPQGMRVPVKKEMLYFLGEDLGDFLVVQGAAVTDFTDLGVLDGLAELGSGGVFKLGGDDFGFFVEEGQDVVAVGDSSGSQVADQTLVALSGFGIVQGDESIVILSGTLSTVAAGDEGSSQDQTLEEDNSSQEAKGSSGG